MAYLEFEPSLSELKIEVGNGPGRDENAVRLDVALPKAEWVRIAEALGELALREGSELRTDFSQAWTLFWKIRQGESRFFVAHPETEQWVGTLAVSPSHLEAIRAHMFSGATVSLSAGQTMSRMNNLEVSIRVREV